MLNFDEKSKSISNFPEELNTASNQYTYKQLHKKESGPINRNIDRSAQVPPSRPNMNKLLEDTRDFARIWDLYNHLLNEA